MTGGRRSWAFVFGAWIVVATSACGLGGLIPEVHSAYGVFVRNNTGVVVEVTVTGADPDPKQATVKPDETRSMSWHSPNRSTDAKARVEARGPDQTIIFCHEYGWEEIRGSGYLVQVDRGKLCS